jgi:hypothetical protein
MKKKLIATVLSLVVLSGLSIPALGADIPDEQWSIPTANVPQASENQGIVIQENLQIAENTSVLGTNLGSSNDQSQVRYCATINDEFCGPAESMYFDAILPKCVNETDTNCVEEISAISANGDEKRASYIRNLPDAGFTDFPAAPSRNLPQGSSPSLWKIPGVLNGGGTDEYLVNFTLRGGVSNKQDKFSFYSYSSFISPVTIKPGRYGRFQKLDARGKDPVACVQLALACGGEMLHRSADNVKICASIEEGACAAKQSFPSGYRFKLKVRLSTSPTGWIHGRIKSPEVSITKVNSGVELSISGEPVVVPVIGVTEPYASLPENMRAFYKKQSGMSYGEQGPTGRRNQLSMPAPDNQETFMEYALWNNYIKDKANASPGFWTARSLDVPSSSAQCFKDSSKFIGVVTTNAMMYSGGPPSFNKELGTLEYKVGAPHLTSKGEVFKGSYDLQVSSEVARCLYNFTSAPIQASISIVNETGEASVATTVVNEKNGWLRLAAYGFTFSNPTVKVKLSQEKEVPVSNPTPTPSATPSASSKPAAAKRISITCVKGKTTKKVTAVNPKCPTGYKKR